jgi:hypothetical protein
MEWQLPIQKVEIGNINIGSPWSSRGLAQKPMAPLSYFGAQFRLPFLSILFPPLCVVEYVPATGKLVLDMSETSLASIKLNTLQDTLINAIMYHQMAWFKTDLVVEEVRQGFQPIIQDNKLILHCPYTDMSQVNAGKVLFKNVPIYKNMANNGYKGGWGEFKPEDLAMGTRVRVAVKIHGISFLNRNDSSEWSGRCRLQHKVLGVIVQA